MSTFRELLRIKANGRELQYALDYHCPCIYSNSPHDPGYLDKHTCLLKLITGHGFSGSIEDKRICGECWDMDEKNWKDILKTKVNADYVSPSE